MELKFIDGASQTFFFHGNDHDHDLDLDLEWDLERNLELDNIPTF